MSHDVSDTVVIERRFRGPPASANGGYASAMVAAAIAPGPAVEVTLRVPPPLDRELTVQRRGEEAELRDGDELVATGRPAEAVELDLPDPVGLDDAAAARDGSPMHERHPYPECFVCGPRRDDGLGLTCGPVPGREVELVASPFETADWMAGPDGNLRPEVVWSALDCPSGIATMLDPDVGVSVLGRLRAQQLAPIPVEPACVAIGWLRGRDGRKLSAATAILGAGGEALAVSDATWIELKDRAG